tara:strand:- start:1885 stop:2061 length:177 start_codon:yes stop_codon:yes gene_type:complete
MEMINIELDVVTAATVRDALFRSTAQDSYEFPSQRTAAIREAIVALDKEIEKVVSAES